MVKLWLPGEWSKDLRPTYGVEVRATNRDHVRMRVDQLGTPDHYVVVIAVHNANNSPALVRVVFPG